MALIRVFATYDLERDEKLFKKLLAQSHRAGAPFQIVDKTAPDSADPSNDEQLRARIKRVDQLVVICTEWTHRAQNVAKEVRIAREESVPYFFLKGRLFSEGAKPSTAVMNDKVYRWNRDSLYSLLQGIR